MLLYHIGAILKIFLGLTILLLIYNFIDPKLDPAMGLGFGFLGLFIFVWGVSFYIFFGGYTLFSEKNDIDCAKESYKLSLLFGIFILLNITLLFLEYWSKLLGFLLLLGFVSLQVVLVLGGETQDDLREF